MSDEFWKDVDHVDIESVTKWLDDDEPRKSGVRMYCTSSPATHGRDNGRFALQLRGFRKVKRGRKSHDFWAATASLDERSIRSLRDACNKALDSFLSRRRKL